MTPLDARSVAFDAARMQAAVVAGIVCLLGAACGGEGGADPDAAVVDAARDAVLVDGPRVTNVPIVCDQDLPPLPPIGPGEPVYGAARCQSAPRRPYPTRGCRVDLRAHRAGDLGTCAAEIAAGTVGNLIGEPIVVTPAHLPLVVDLPEGTNDAACATVCQKQQGETITRFGVRIHVEGVTTFLSMRVEPPWFFVTGNETAPTLCHDGHPTVLELGRPVACAFTYAQEIDLITADPSPPPARVVIASDDLSNEWSNCCLYPPQ